VPAVLAAISGFGAHPPTFAAASSGPSVTPTRKKRSRPVGTSVRYTLNEPASVTFTVKRRARGRRVKRGKRRVCVRPTQTNRKKRRCFRYVRVRGSFTRNGVAGQNRFHFTGRLRGRKLRTGRYRLYARPTVGGVKGKAVSTRFRIVP
jgi:hypothetical protein